MQIDWGKFEPNSQLDDLSKSLVREITENFVITGTGLPDREKRVQLGRDRRLLDALVQGALVMNNANRYYPRFAALYFLTPELRGRCEEATAWVLKASRSLYREHGTLSVSLVEISDQINRLASGPVGQHTARIGMQFARDFTHYFGDFQNSADTPTTSFTVYENILDFEDIPQAWQEELDRRPPHSAGNAPFAIAKAEDASSSPPQHLQILADKSRRVFVIHGRDERLRVGIFTFLRALRLEPLEWTKAMDLTKKASPYIGEILEAAFKHAQAAVVLLTPDDETRLREDLARPDDPQHERVLTGQARPNVLFEAGMAFASHPHQTVLVQLGQLRPFSDIAGRHIVKMDNSVQKRHELALKLRTAGCTVDMEGTDWQSVGDLKPPVGEITSLPSPVHGAPLGNPKPAMAESRLGKVERIVIAPVSKATSEKEFTLEKVDEFGVLIRVSDGVLVRVPMADYIESWDDTMEMPKLILTRKYFQGYYPGHENATEYFLPR